MAAIEGAGRRIGGPGPVQQQLIRLAGFLAVAGPPLVLAVVGWQRRWLAEDGFITLRVVRQLVAGHGPVFNVGERVEASTSALWTFMLALGDVITPMRLEALAVGGGLALSVVGLSLAGLGARQLWAGPSNRTVVPLGALVVLAVRPFWDFATSGLESGLTFAWLGGSGWLLARAATRPRDRACGWPAAIVLGLGPLVRPDLALMAGPFLALLVFLRGANRREAVTLILTGLALPVAYQVFRMGFFAALVPAPALAKEASEARWVQGWHYLSDLSEPYLLAVPLVALTGMSVVGSLGCGWRDPARVRRMVVLAVVPLSGFLHGLYVVRVGGDFMHARLLLPSLFAICLPVVVVSPPRRVGWVPVAVVAAWAVMLTVSPPSLPYEGIGPRGIADERAVWTALTGRAHPVYLEDYRETTFWQIGNFAAQHVRERGSGIGLELGSGFVFLRPGPRSPARVGIVVKNVGVLGMAAGRRVFVVDLHGLTDPLAGRVRRLPSRIGHEKLIDLGWVWARFVADDEPVPAGGPEAQAIDQSRRAMECGPLRRLLAATSDPLTLARFVRNLGDAFRLHRLRFDRHPEIALAQVCGPFNH